MTDTINNGIPFVPENTIDPAAGLNLSLNTIDALLQVLVQTVGANTPPAGVEGQRFIVGTTPTGAWAGQANKLARYLDAAWEFYDARYALNAADGLWYVRQSSTWSALAGGAPAWGSITGTLSAQTDLQGALDGKVGTGDSRLTDAREWSAETVSQAEAEAGTANTRRAWTAERVWQAVAAWWLTVTSSFGRGLVAAADAAAGRTALSVREALSANRTYYVRTDGSDSNNGLSDTAGGAFLTIQNAVNAAASIDIGIYDVTISVSPGVYAEGAGVKLKNLVGSGRLIIVGSGGSPSDVSVSTSGVLTTADAVFTSPGASGRFYVDNLALSSTGSGARYAISASGGSTVEFGNVEFGSGFNIHILAFDAGVVRAAASYSVTGGGAAHSSAGQNGVIRIASVSVTITGTPAFAIAFAISAQSGVQVITGVTFSGSATGPRYSAVLNGVINTNGAGDSYLPGSSAGATATGGQYA